MKKVILWGVAVVAFFGFLMVVGKPSQTAGNRNNGGGQLIAIEAAHDFGTISMKDGNVKRIYQIKNVSDQPLTITKLQTSCMCTTAELTAGDQRVGPFGMQGHGGSVPDISVPLAPEQTAEVEVVFDPAAHGAAGVGEIKRSVLISTAGNPNLELTFKAMVRP